jgi:ribosomal protein S18 acetylase RimI-like enzyme
MKRTKALDMRVRSIQDEEDVRELMRAHARAWEAAYEGVLPDTVIQDVADADPGPGAVRIQYERLAEYDDDKVVVVEDDDGTVRGYAVFRWGADETKSSVRDGEAELKELYVDPDWWGGGFGTALLQAGIDRLPTDIDSLALETLVGNDIGIAFYEARGFERDGTASFETEAGRHRTYVYRKQLP